MSKGFGGGGGGGYTGARDMINGGGPGASGATFSGGGMVSTIANGAGISPFGQGNNGAASPQNGAYVERGGSQGFGSFGDLMHQFNEIRRTGSFLPSDWGSQSAPSAPAAALAPAPAAAIPTNMMQPAAQPGATAGMPGPAQTIAGMGGGGMTPAMMQILQSMMPQGADMGAMNLRPLFNRGA